MPLGTGKGITLVEPTVEDLLDVVITAPVSGQSLTYDAANHRWINATPAGGGSGTVTSVSAGIGLSASPNPITGTGEISLANTSVSAGSYTLANITVDAQGRITTASNGAAGSGTVTSVSAGGGLTASTNPITNTGDISILNTAVSGGSYSFPNFTVNSRGQLTAAAENAITGSGSIVLATGPTMTNPIVGTQGASDNSTKGASTAYVTAAIAAAIAGVNPATSVLVATTQASDTSGLTYNNGAAGIGATLTGSNNTALTFDGVTLTSLNQRVLVKNDTQSPSGAFNGVYYLTQIQTAILPPILTRALDYNQPSDINSTGAIPVVSGTVNADTSWLLTSNVTTVGTDALTYVQFSLNPSTIITTSTSAGGDLTNTYPNPAIAAAAVTNAKMANMAAVTMKANAKTSAAAPSDVSFSTFLDAAVSAAQGDIIYRGGSTWTRLAAGTSGQYLQTLGASANPAWGTIAGGGTVTSVSVSAKSGIAVSGSPVTSSGVITLSLGAITPTSINTAGVVSAASLNVTGDILAAGGRITASAATLSAKLTGATASFSGLVSADAGVNTTIVSAASINTTGDIKAATGRITASAATVTSLLTGATASFSGKVSADAGLNTTVVSAASVNVTGDILAATGRVTASAATLSAKLTGATAAFSGLVSADAGIRATIVSADSINITGDMKAATGRVTASAATITSLLTGATAAFSGKVSADAGLNATTVSATSIGITGDLNASTGRIIASAATFSAIVSGINFVTPIVSVAFNGTTNVDGSLGSYFRGTAVSAFTLSAQNVYDGQKIIFEIIQDATGSRILTAGSQWAFGTDITAAVLSTAANKRDFVGGFYNATATKLYITAFVKGY